jgi:deoxyhypusine synthase
MSGEAGNDKGNSGNALPAGLEGMENLVFGKSETMPAGTPVVRGVDFASDPPPTAEDVLRSFATTGFQATNFACAVAEVKRMLAWRLSDATPEELALLGVTVRGSAGDIEGPDAPDDVMDPEDLAKVGCRIFLGYTSNMISCGVRETIRFLAQRRLVDVIVSTAGGIEEDFIKCMAPAYIGAFDFAPGPELRRKGLNRTGNLIVPNDNYCLFEDWLTPILDAMLVEQREHGIVWTPSKMIDRLGAEIGKLGEEAASSSVYYWCHKNRIPVFSPALTDGSIGDVLYFHSIRNPGLVLDIVQDIRAINDLAVRARRTGQIVLGGGLVKHHVLNANLMRNGAHYSVFVNTGQEFDGSDAGARPDEALSWGKIHITGKPVKLYADASLAFPLIVSQSFAKLGPEGRGDIET